LLDLGITLENVPLDEVLAFRDQYGKAYRRYRRNIKEFVRKVSSLNDNAREDAIKDRQEDLREELET
jgi:hypothetical protein